MIDIDNMTGAEKLQLFAKLATALCGTGGPFGSNGYILPLPIVAIPAGETRAIAARVYRDIKPRRLVIFEPEIECTLPNQVVLGEIVRTIEERRWWFGKTKKVVEKKPVLGDLVSKQIIKRDGWRVCGAFIGADILLDAYASIPGSAFGGDPAFDFNTSSLLQAGLDFSLQIRNEREHGASFFAAIVGEVVEPKSRSIRSSFMGERDKA